jgi:hypothetical protein
VLWRALLYTVITNLLSLKKSEISRRSMLLSAYQEGHSLSTVLRASIFNGYSVGRCIIRRTLQVRQSRYDSPVKKKARIVCFPNYRMCLYRARYRPIFQERYDRIYLYLQSVLYK